MNERRGGSEQSGPLGNYLWVLAIRRPKQGVGQQAPEVGVLEVFRMAQRGVENATAVMDPRPRDRLGVVGNAAGQKYFRFASQAGILVQAADRLERLDAGKDGMPLGLV